MTNNERTLTPEEIRTFDQCIIQTMLGLFLIPLFAIIGIHLRFHVFFNMISGGQPDHICAVAWFLFVVSVIFPSYLIDIIVTPLILNFEYRSKS